MTEQIKYKTFSEASIAAAILQIKSSNDYAYRHELDPRLPSSPDTYYNDFKAEGGWLSFLYKRKSQKYDDFEQASNAASLELCIKSSRAYEHEYKADPKLPCRPDFFYVDFEAKGGWEAFLKRDKTTKYETFEVASKAAIKMLIKNIKQYKIKNRLNKRLPTSPDTEYLDFESKGGWSTFLNQPVIYSYEEASSAVLVLGIETYVQYQIMRKLDPRLPGHPQTYYYKFTKRGGWLSFTQRNFYKTFSAASSAAVKLNIRDNEDYNLKFNQDPMLPVSPVSIYKDFNARGGWDKFLRLDKYTYKQASKVAINLGVVDALTYQEVRNKDIRLPISPECYYDKFIILGAWDKFIQNTSKYASFNEASKAAVALGIVSLADYMLIGRNGDANYTQDPRLPKDPNAYYNDFEKLGGYVNFFQLNSKYESYQEASNAAVKLGIKSSNDYMVLVANGKPKYKQDYRLPCRPNKFYSNFYLLGGWDTFLQRVTKYSYREASLAAVALGIKSSLEYRLEDENGVPKYKQDPRLPVDP
ncbi:MAG: hypothetical protein HRT95_03705 [Moritella sp.]|uniref:integrase repeat-containing protein n=1 Tax=Moritella sp. TaxID=78556 RepID=UPI001DBDA14E|nr:integrase repeat-containing protein [Moritella sp.]NQZ49310.1 hypothetical protein [Moritella sp.]